MAGQPERSGGGDSELRRRIKAARDRGPLLDWEPADDAPLFRRGSAGRTGRFGVTPRRRNLRVPGIMQLWTRNRLALQTVAALLLFALLLGLDRLPGPASSWARTGVSWLLTAETDLSGIWQDLQAQPVLAPVLSSLPDLPAALEASTESRFARPVEGSLLRGYGEQQAEGEPFFHSGVDIAAEPGSPVRSLAGGVVRRVGFEEETYGLFVLLQHDGWQGLYANLESVTVQEGEELPPAFVIGSTGGDGESGGDWLHFEVYQDNRPVDPAPFLRPFQVR